MTRLKSCALRITPVCPAGGATPSIDAMLAVASDQLAEQLDAAHGSEVVDPSIFRAHAAKYEVRGCRTYEAVQQQQCHSSSASRLVEISSEVVDPSIFRAHAAKYEVRHCWMLKQISQWLQQQLWQAW
jgi:hypothetical protein